MRRKSQDSTQLRIKMQKLQMLEPPIYTKALTKSLLNYTCSKHHVSNYTK
jgi:hypothetical protein